MTKYCILGQAEPFKTNNDFYHALKDQIVEKNDNSFYNADYPLSHFNFSWSNGYLVLNIYNSKTNREEHIALKRKTFQYCNFSSILEKELPYYLPELYNYPEYPEPERTTFWQVLWTIVKWIFGATFWLLGAILKCIWSIIKWFFKSLFS